MKRILYITGIALLGLLMTSCQAEEGAVPGKDANPHVTIYQYTPSSEYNSDEDVQIRFVKNNQVTSAKYFVEKKTDKDAAIKANGEDAYIQKVISEGSDINFTDGVADVTFTGLANVYDISVVAVNGDKKGFSAATFEGLAWKAGVAGTYNFSAFLPSNEYTAASVATEFQQCEFDEDLYRFKDLYGAGKSLKVRMTDDDPVQDADGNTYQYFRVENQALPFTYLTHGTLYIRDIGYAVSEDYFYALGQGYDCGVWEDGHCVLNVGYFVAAGRASWGWDETFIPNP